MNEIGIYPEWSRQMTNLVSKPLNGEKTHPLKSASYHLLRSLMTYPRPRPEVNPGVRDRLSREGLIEEVMLPSPYEGSKGKPYPHIKITITGIMRLEEIAAANQKAANSSRRQGNASGATDGA